MGFRKYKNGMPPIGSSILLNCKVYKSSKFERILAKIIPYHFPFLSKRKRVIIRRYFRNRWKTRCNNDIVKALDGHIAEPPDRISWTNEDWEWDVIPNK